MGFILAMQIVSFDGHTECWWCRDLVMEVMQDKLKSQFAQMEADKKASS